VLRSNSFLQTRITETEWVRGQAFFNLTVFIFAGNAVVLRYSRQLVGSCTINELFTLN